MGVLRVMSRRGDDRAIWDLKQAEVGKSDAVAAIDEAERIFAAERARGATAFKVESQVNLQCGLMSLTRPLSRL